MDGMTWLFLVCSITVAWLPCGAGHPPLRETFRTKGYKEALAFRWEDSAARVTDSHHKVWNVV